MPSPHRISKFRNDSERLWQADSEEQVARWISTGLGIRPEGWWRYESDRPDLAAGACDLYVHLRDGDHLERERAEERLRYLVEHGQLSDGELKAIAAGTGARFEWRQAVLAGRRTVR